MTEIEFVDHLPVWPARPTDAHKGTFGTVIVVAGSVGMSGAAVLCGSAALRGGAGLVKLVVPELIAALVAVQQPCYMVAGASWDRLDPVLEAARTADAVVAGPGLGRGPKVRELVGRLCELDVPLVLDADALNVLGMWPGVWRNRMAPTLITPHPGEFARLTGQKGGERVAGAVELARREGVIVVLKGAGTVVTDGRRVFVNTTGNPGMATGGTGDVLAGLLGALLAQGFSAFEAAQLAVYLHGRAGDQARDRVGEVSLIATDILDSLPVAIRQQTSRK
ncbi:MAG: NAD(P)H-hydrate dehydratase [Planctomycetia bacterium]|nr:NAD(P)H-hydrate dehydratase [Planctomycetia bacterium]